MQTSWWDAVSRGDGGGLAQRIVDVLAPVVRQNINLMNSSGIIVASTDPERIGAEHRAALQVLETGQAVVVREPRDGIPDRPGINLPLIIDGHLTGVIGVTGEPEAVEPLAHVVVLTVELLIEQEREHHTSMVARSRAREIVAALVSDGQSLLKVGELLRAEGLGEGPWSLGVWAAPEPRQDGSAQPPHQAENIVMEINEGRSPSGRPTARAVVWRGLLWVVSGAARLDESLGEERSRRLVTSGVATLEDLRSWAQDMAALARAVGLLPTGTEAAPVPAELAIALAHLPQHTMRRVADLTSPLTQAQHETVRAVAYAGSLAEGARMLYLHRNTLLQRVERIRNLTGLDLRRSDQATLLTLSVLARDTIHE
ncbi:CdaR family transcriptional regulator [Nesterenkonia flava]|uniref:Sugar diacid recognition domain-containing protein n=1 Tax=Nesterenkonia flava TaxID=469799 RepID=A0ABU1FRY7_9MICC|nr:sugar diacid recognition domain-containing protein [Nesterenkonia flava]MDR5711007.1 sugar diacid recognition domain-containing protein [Nesterenkonia flava]